MKRLFTAADLLLLLYFYGMSAFAAMAFVYMICALFKGIRLHKLGWLLLAISFIAMLLFVVFSSCFDIVCIMTAAVLNGELRNVVINCISADKAIPFIRSCL